MITREDVLRIARDVGMHGILTDVLTTSEELQAFANGIAALVVERQKVNADPQGNMESNGTANPVVRPAVSAPDVEAVAYLYTDEKRAPKKTWASCTLPSAFAPNELSENEVVVEPLYSQSSVAAQVEKARREEREACAKECDIAARSDWNDDRRAQAKALAKAIRQRGEKA